MARKRKIFAPSEDAITAAVVTYERLRELLHYDPETGFFTRKSGRGGRAQGSVSGCKPNSDFGYVLIGVDGGLYLAHCLAFIFMTGVCPSEDIDHINGVKDDNRWINLRAATRSQNNANSRLRKDNTSGLKGVYFSQERRRWVAQIGVNGRQTHLGRFATREAAHAAYTAAAHRYFGDFARLA
jgi:hypothetical protein